jgi:hypothetical protein
VNPLYAILDSSSSIASIHLMVGGPRESTFHASTSPRSIQQLYQHDQGQFRKFACIYHKHCPNLEIFIVGRPLKGAFGPVADVLKTYVSRRLQTLHWNVTGDPFLKSFEYSIRYLVLSPRISLSIPRCHPIKNALCLALHRIYPFTYPTCSNSHYDGS